MIAVGEAGVVVRGECETMGIAIMPVNELATSIEGLKID